MLLFWLLVPLSWCSLWIPEGTREVFSRSLIERSDLVPALPLKVGEDIFASPYPAIGGDSNIVAFSSILESLGWISEDIEDEDFCSSFFEAFFINRPPWFIPTRLEVLRARKCFKGYVALVDSQCEQETADCSLLVSMMGKLAIGLFSDYTEYVLKRLGPSRSFACSSRLQSFNWDFYKEAIGVLATAPDAMAQQVLQLLAGGSEASLVHASDYLDMYGMTPESLSVWQAFLSFPEIDRILTREFRKRPDVIVKPSMAHFHRLVKLERDPILSIELGTEIRMRLLRANLDVEIIDRLGNSEIVPYGRNKWRLMRVFQRLSEATSSGSLGSPHTISAETIAGLMFMTKINRDPLGTLVAAITAVMGRTL